MPLAGRQGPLGGVDLGVGVLCGVSRVLSGEEACGGVLRMDLKGWGAKWPGSPKSAHVVTPGVHRGPVGPAGPSPRSAPTKLFWVRPGPRAWAGTQRVEGRRLETGPLNMPGGEGALSRTQPPFTVPTPVEAPPRGRPPVHSGGSCVGHLPACQLCGQQTSLRVNGAPCTRKAA